MTYNRRQCKQYNCTRQNRKLRKNRRKRFSNLREMMWHPHIFFIYYFVFHINHKKGAEKSDSRKDNKKKNAWWFLNETRLFYLLFVRRGEKRNSQIVFVCVCVLVNEWPKKRAHTQCIKIHIVWPVVWLVDSNFVLHASAGYRNWNDKTKINRRELIAIKWKWLTPNNRLIRPHLMTIKY